MSKIKLCGYILSVCALLGTALVYEQLPTQMAIHFNVSGIADEYASKVVIWLLASFPLMMMMLFQVLAMVDPKKEAYEKFIKAYDYIVLCVVVMLVAILGITIGVNLGYALNVTMLTQVIVSLLIIGLGNYLVQVKPNYFIGIKTPWTLASDRVWQQTHRHIGRLFVLVGVIGLLLCMKASSETFLIIISAQIGLALYSVIYSYRQYQKHHH